MQALPGRCSCRLPSLSWSLLWILLSLPSEDTVQKNKCLSSATVLPLPSLLLRFLYFAPVLLVSCHKSSGCPAHLTSLFQVPLGWELPFCSMCAQPSVSGPRTCSFSWRSSKHSQAVMFLLGFLEWQHEKQVTWTPDSRLQPWCSGNAWMREFSAFYLSVYFCSYILIRTRLVSYTVFYF